jgi:hypothetical protein
MAVVRATGDPGPEMHQLTAGTSGAPFYDHGAYLDTKSGWKLTCIKYIDKTYGYILLTVDGNAATITFKGRVSPGQYEAMDRFDYTANPP